MRALYGGHVSHGIPHLPSVATAMIAVNVVVIAGTVRRDRFKRRHFGRPAGPAAADDRESLRKVDIS